VGVESAYAGWIRQFAARAEERGTGRSEPDWGRAARLRPEIVRSVQRFQVGKWQFVDEVTREFRAAVRSVLRITDGRRTTAANVAAAGVRR
jgi:hypothetical protein